jgi:hypothetical protein
MHGDLAMSQEQTSDDFDWVRAQAKCSAAAMYEQLRARVREDVQRRNGVLDRGDGWTFEFYEDDDGFEASRLVASGRSDRRVLALVRFERDGRRITIRGEDVDVELTAIVTIDHAGACRYVVGEAVYSDWEIRKMALEQLFFEESEDDSD